MDFYAKMQANSKDMQVTKRLIRMIKDAYNSAESRA